MTDDTTDYSGQQNIGSSNRGLITIIYLLVLFIVVNEILNEYGYRTYGGGRVRWIILRFCGIPQ